MFWGGGFRILLNHQSTLLIRSLMHWRFIAEHAIESWRSARKRVNVSAIWKLCFCPWLLPVFFAFWLPWCEQLSSAMLFALPSCPFCSAASLPWTDPSETVSWSEPLLSSFRCYFVLETGKWLIYWLTRKFAKIGQYKLDMEVQMLKHKIVLLLFLFS